LVKGDTNGRADVFVGYLGTRKISRSASPPARKPRSCAAAAITPDGSRLVYQTTASNITKHDYNGRSDVLLAAWGPRTYDRVQAGSLYAVAAQASRRCAPNGADAVVIANGSDWRAAVAGSSLAGAVRGPLLYVGKTWLHPETKAEIVRLGAKRIYVVGGPSAVSAGVVEGLTGIVGAGAVERAVRVTRTRWEQQSPLGSQTSRAARQRDGARGAGSSYRAAIAGVPMAAGSSYPVVFVNPATGSYKLPART
jgi:hypothetical protein